MPQRLYIIFVGQIGNPILRLKVIFHKSELHIISRNYNTYRICYEVLGLLGSSASTTMDIDSSVSTVGRSDVGDFGEGDGVFDC
jgi:hypothetical protein